MLDKLIAIQHREELHDGAMAARLGISRSAWNLIRRQKLALGHGVAVRAAGAWPELSRDLLDRASATVPGAQTVTDHSDADTQP
jgi:hypothetical protein